MVFLLRKRSLEIMATAGIQFKIMPESIDTDIELKALIVTIALSENEESDAVEKTLSEIEGVSSVELIDYRRVVG